MSMLSRSRITSLWFFLASTFGIGIPCANALDIVVTFEGTAWDGKKQAVFNEVVELWEKQLQGAIPVQLKVSLIPLSGNVQGWGRPTCHRRIAAFPVSYVRYAISEWAQIVADPQGATVAEDPENVGFHMVMAFDSDYEYATVSGTLTTDYPWNWDCSKPPQTRPLYDANGVLIKSVTEQDFVTVALHELGHALGFLSEMLENGSQLVPNEPSAYDIDLGATYPDPDVVSFFLPLQSAVRSNIMKSGTGTSGMLFWNGAVTRQNALSNIDPPRVLLGGYIQMNTPTTWDASSSVSHWARALANVYIMAPTGNNATWRSLDLTPLVLRDIGWGTNDEALSQKICETTPSSAAKSAIMLGTCVSNYSGNPLIVSGAEIIGADANQFEFASNYVFPITVAPYQRQAINVQFNPTSLGRKKAYLRLEYVGTSFHREFIDLIGNSVGPDADDDAISDYDEMRDLDTAISGVQNPFNPTRPDSTRDGGIASTDGLEDGLNDWDGDGICNRDEFLLGLDPLKAIVSSNVVLFNTGNWEIIVTGIQLIGANPNQFSLPEFNQYLVVPPGRQHDLRIAFRPTSVGVKTATLRIIYFDGIINRTKDITLTGSGV